MFEELPKQVFIKADRRSGLDVNHLKVVLEKLAKLHATTAMLNNDDADLFSYHQQPNISEYFKIFHSLFHNCVQSLVNETSTEISDEAQELVGRLKAFERNMIDKASEAFMLQNDEFGVLCHGDLWLENLLFEYEDGDQIKDVKMVS